MTRQIPWAATVAVLALAGAAWCAETPTTPAQTAFERLRSLEGKWAGPARWEQGAKTDTVDFAVTYKVTSGGSVVLETLFPGTPGEMLTLYHMDGEDLVLTHYCRAGNQPHMKLEASTDPNALPFACLGGSNMKEEDFHMHAARITFVDADHVQSTWRSVKAGETQWTAEAALVRAK